MLEVTVVNKDKASLFSSSCEHAYVFFIPREDEAKELSESYVVVKTDYITKSNYIIARHKNTNEILSIYDFGKIELFTIGGYNVTRYKWFDKEKTLIQSVDNLKAAKEWAVSGKALFSLGVAHVYIDSINYVVTMYVPPRYAVRFGNTDAFVIL